MKKPIGLFLALVMTATMAPRARAATNPELEVEMTMATIDFQAKSFDKCKEKLQKILKTDAANSGALELLALVERQQKDDEAAAKTYEKLLQVGDHEKVPAYSFELAMIRYKEKKYDQARKLFDLAANSNFNAGTSHFFLGVIEFNAKAWRKARHHLTASLTYSDAKAMEPVTRYYLANSYAQIGKSDAAIHNYYEAEQSAADSSQPGRTGFDNLTQGIRNNALKQLKDLDKGSKYATISILQQFDSNVQTNPSEVENAVASSSERSGKAVMSINAGYTSSPTEKLQFAPSFSYFTNYNYNYLARNFNFMTFTPALLLNYKPYSRFAFGLKSDGIFSMQNMLDPNESQRDLKYRPFSLTGDAGPVMKYELTPRINVVSETYWRPKRFYLDPATGPSRRSGGGVYSKLSSEFVSGYTWWNPMAYVSFEWDHPAGTDFRMYSWGGGLSNTISVTEKISVTGSWDLVSYDYTDTVPKRDDFNMVFRAVGGYTIDAHWSASADISYTNNDSSLSTIYKYDRWVGSLGATYSL